MWYSCLDAFGEAGVEVNYGYRPIPSNAVLNVDLELVSLKPVIDVVGDMKVLKKILRAGEGVRTPNDGETVYGKMKNPALVFCRIIIWYLFHIKVYLLIYLYFVYTT